MDGEAGGVEGDQQLALLPALDGDARYAGQAAQPRRHDLLGHAAQHVGPQGADELQGHEALLVAEGFRDLGRKAGDDVGRQARAQGGEAVGDLGGVEAEILAGGDLETQPGLPFERTAFETRGARDAAQGALDRRGDQLFDGARRGPGPGGGDDDGRQLGRGQPLHGQVGGLPGARHAERQGPEQDGARPGEPGGEGRGPGGLRQSVHCETLVSVTV